MATVSTESVDWESAADTPRKREAPDDASERPKQAKEKRSVQEETASQFTKALRRGQPTHGIKGWLNTYDQSGKELFPYAHQRDCVEKFVTSTVGLIAHDAGLGKTATAFLLASAIQTVKGNGSMIVTAPSSTLPQWEETARDWVNVAPQFIHVTTKEASLTWHLVKKARIIVVSRDCLARAYKSCHEWVEQDHKNDRNQWVGAWRRKRETRTSSQFRAALLGYRKECALIKKRIQKNKDSDKDFELRRHLESCQQQIHDLEEHQKHVNEMAEKRGGVVYVPLHALFRRRYKSMFADEVHFMRNPETGWTVSHAFLSRFCDQRFGLSATPIFNKSLDMVGLNRAIGTDVPDYQQSKRDMEFERDIEKRRLNTSFGEELQLSEDDRKKLREIGKRKRENAELAKLCDPNFWSLDKKGTDINPKAVAAFEKIKDRVTDEILGLPDIIQKVVRFDVDLDAEHADTYNSLVEDARQLRMDLDNVNKKEKGDLKRLMAKLQQMQQMVVSPLLQEKSSAKFKENAELAKEAVKNPSGSLKALETLIRELPEKEGIKRIIIACNHVEPMKIAREYLRTRCASVAAEFVLAEDTAEGTKTSVQDEIDRLLNDEEDDETWDTEVAKEAKKQRRINEKTDELMKAYQMFEGSMNQSERQKVKQDFLTSNKTSSMFLSIGAGGTGVHLVGKPSDKTAVIFWGSSPFSPAQVWQTLKRAHRIGQEHEVHVYHVIAYGSVDDAIRKGHKDKENLSKFVIDGDRKALGEMGELALQAAAAEAQGNESLQGCTWKQVGRYVDMCLEMVVDEETGRARFPREPTAEELAEEARKIEEAKEAKKRADAIAKHGFDPTRPLGPGMNMGWRPPVAPAARAVPVAATRVPVMPRVVAGPRHVHLPPAPMQMPTAEAWDALDIVNRAFGINSRVSRTVPSYQPMGMRPPIVLPSNAGPVGPGRSMPHPAMPQPAMPQPAMPQPAFNNTFFSRANLGASAGSLLEQARMLARGARGSFSSL